MPEAKERFALAGIESVEKFVRWLVRGIGRVMGGGTGCGGVGDSARAETSARASWRDRASKRTRRSGDEAVPRISTGSRSWYPVKGINCRPEEIKPFKGFESAFTGSMSTM